MNDGDNEDDFGSGNGDVTIGMLGSSKIIGQVVGDAVTAATEGDDVDVDSGVDVVRGPESSANRFRIDIFRDSSISPTGREPVSPQSATFYIG